MAQLDQLINAMLQHGAEALTLEPGEKPSLLLGGTPRPIVKSALAAAHVSSLAAEIAPQELRAAIGGGGTASFSYDLGAETVQVEVTPGPRAVIRPGPPEPPARRTSAIIRPARVAADVAEHRVDRPLQARVEEPAESDDETCVEVDAGSDSVIPEEPRSPLPVSDAAPAPIVDPAMVEATPSECVTMDILLRMLVERGGSDLHVSSECRPMIRVDGELQTLSEVPSMGSAEAEQVLLSIAPERNRDEFRDTGDTDFAYEIEDLCRFRCNMFKDRKGPGGVFRIIPSKILTVDDLNLSQAIRNLCFLTKGLVLVTGPTGSGKSTTLCGMVDHINENRRDHVITIEDPIEFVHPNKSCLINQREVHMHTKGFKPALRAALREDPDVVLVGELRDLETVAIAIETAETGHLVFGTLHTSSAVSTVDRIIDQFPADQQEQIRIMLSESLKGVIAQVLCRKIGGGRVAALEVLIVNPAISNLIREGKTFQIPSIMQTQRAQGNVLLNASLAELVKKKLVEPAEAYAKAIDKANLLGALKKMNVPTDFAERKKSSELQPA